MEKNTIYESSISYLVCSDFDAECWATIITYVYTFLEFLELI
jgi:hypothetical protein